jgi:copper chaperone CopZ
MCLWLFTSKNFFKIKHYNKMKFLNTTLIVLVAVASMSFTPNKKQPKTTTTTFWVAGVCGMCETTIEKAMDTKGVVAADFDLATNMLTVTYKPAKITEEQLHKLLNEVGYDTAKSKCTDEQYARTHSCCKYRESEKH